MKGSIYTSQKCFLCQQNGSKGTLKYVEGHGYLACPDHPEMKWTGSCDVHFGREHHKRFKSVAEGERHLTFLRVQTDRGEFDQRDWAKDQPLSFLTLREKFVKVKQTQEIKQKQIQVIERTLKRAGEFKSDHHGRIWDHLHIKQISEAEIDDFFSFDHRKFARKRMADGSVKIVDDGPLGKKSIANMRSVIHDFFKWVVRREKKRSNLEMPEIPDIQFKMKMREIVSVEDQQAVLDEVNRLTWDFNPRIWLGIKLLSIYPRVRPGEMVEVKEGHINLTDGWIVFPQPKEKDPKFIHLLPEFCEMIKEIRDMVPPTLPDVYFFRHITTRSGVKAGTQFGPGYFNKWWKKAAKNLGINSVSVYPGTKHSTTTALGKIMSPEEIKHNVTGHTSNAFERYFLPDHKDAITATRQVAQMQSGKHLVNISELRKTSN